MVEAFEQFNGHQTLIISRTSYNGQQSIPENRTKIAIAFVIMLNIYHQKNIRYR